MEGDSNESLASLRWDEMNDATYSAHLEKASIGVKGVGLYSENSRSLDSIAAFSKQGKVAALSSENS